MVVCLPSKMAVKGDDAPPLPPPIPHHSSKGWHNEARQNGHGFRALGDGAVYELCQ